MRLAIGIPTRNRAELAVAAVESVLRAGRTDITVVVSDNSTEAADRDRLIEFCARHPDGAVEYVRPPEPLAMPAHWEWLWGVINERMAATHVAYMTDRMVFTAGALEELMEIVSAAPDLVLSYQHDRVDDLRTPVELVQAQWTGQLLQLDARKLIEMTSRAAWGDHLPRMMNSIAPTGTLAEIEERFGDVFGSTSPDYRFAYRCLAVCDTVLYLDRSCLIQHGMNRSAGITYLRGTPNEEAASFARELTGPRFGATPEPAFETVANAIFQEYCSVRAEVGGGRFPPPDWRSYLTANAISIDRITDPQWGARMRGLLRQRGWRRRHSARHVLGLTLEMAGYFLRHPGALARTIKRQLWERPPGTPAAFLLPRVGLSPGVRDNFRFDSAADAIAHANAHPRPRTPYAWPVHRLWRAGAIARRHRNAGSDARSTGKVPARPDGADRDHPHSQPAGDPVRDPGSPGRAAGPRALRGDRRG
jgi:hypothetical protein